MPAWVQQKKAKKRIAPRGPKGSPTLELTRPDQAKLVKFFPTYWGTHQLRGHCGYGFFFGGRVGHRVHPAPQGKVVSNAWAPLCTPCIAPPHMVVP